MMNNLILVGSLVFKERKKNRKKKYHIRPFCEVCTLNLFALTIFKEFGVISNAPMSTVSRINVLTVNVRNTHWVYNNYKNFNLMNLHYKGLSRRR